MAVVSIIFLNLLAQDHKALDSLYIFRRFDSCEISKIDLKSTKY